MKTVVFVLRDLAGEVGHRNLAPGALPIPGHQLRIKGDAWRRRRRRHHEIAVAERVRRQAPRENARLELAERDRALFVEGRVGEGRRIVAAAGGDLPPGRVERVLRRCTRGAASSDREAEEWNAPSRADHHRRELRTRVVKKRQRGARTAARSTRQRIARACGWGGAGATFSRDHQRDDEADAGGAVSRSARQSPAWPGHADKNPPPRYAAARPPRGPTLQSG